MEEEGRTIIVCGLPMGLEERRLMDKLCIHFLRKKNGGGEITSITLPKSMPRCALITFEESEVAHRVAQRGKHSLSVDSKTFELTVSLFRKEVDPNEVFLSMEIVVDYSRLPLGRVALSSLRQSFPDVRLNFNTLEELCTLKGRYSEVQDLISHLLNLIDPQASAAPHMSKPEDSFGTPLPSGKESSASESGHCSRGTERQMESRYSGQASGQNLGSWDIDNYERDQGVDQILDNYGGLEDRADTLLEEAPLEDFSLVMDSDIFRYLRQYCGEDYQYILSQHRVEVVDVCTQDVTTIYLQAEAGAPGREVERVQRVHGELGRLYQQLEARLRKEQLPKEGIQSESLKQAFEALQHRLPKLMLSEDRTYIYIVGSGGDVSEAKQFLLDMQGPEGGSRFRGGGAGYPKPLVALDRDALFPSSSSTSTSVSTVPILDVRGMDKMRKSHKTERVETGKEYKLAARFKEVMSKNPRDGELWSTLDETKASGDTLKDFSFKLRLDSGHRLGTGPVVGAGNAGTGIGGFTQRDHEGLNQTEKDFLFKKNESLYPTSMESKPHSTLMHTSDVLPKTMQFTNTQSTVHQMDLFGSKGAKISVIPPSGPGTQNKLKRSNSFSGRVRPMQDLKESGTHGDIQGKANRTSSLSNRTAHEVYSIEVPVPAHVWQYLIDCYRTQVDDITTDVQMKEIHSGNTVTLQLEGADVARVGVCRDELRKLVSMVTVDFHSQEVPLAMLGVTDHKDEILAETCMELNNRFEKVKIWPVSRSVFIMGPKHLCEQVFSSLMEIFCSGTEKTKEIEEQMEGPSYTSPLTQNQIATPQTLTDHVEDQVSASMSYDIVNEGLIETTGIMSADILQFSRDKQMEGGQGSGSRGKDNFQRKHANRIEKKHDSDIRKGGSPSAVQKEPVLKQKLGKDWTTSRESLRAETTLTQPTKVSNRDVHPEDSGPVSLPAFAFSTQKVVLPNKESNPKPYSTNALMGHSTPHPEVLESPEGKGPKHQDTTKGQESGQKEEQTEKIMPCVCGASSDITKMPCGVFVCPRCLVRLHSLCKVCHKDAVRGIRGTMSLTEMSVTLPGHIKDMTLKITYNIPDGIQGEEHPNPGHPFQGGIFEAFLPLNDHTRRLLPLLKKAFDQGLTFTVTESDTGGKVTWGSIPHKTRVDRGKSGNGYPDSGYLSRLTEALKPLSTEEDKTIAKTKNKTKN